MTAATGWSRLARHLPIGVLVLLPLILLAPIVFAGRVLYWGVPLMQFYPWQHFAVETWRLGEVPLWNPLLGNGAPLAANLQTGVFYPLNFLYLLLPTEVAMGYTAALHVVLAGLFMYAFMRSIGLRALSALVAAIAFQLSGFLIARLGFLSITVTLPWVVAWLWRGECLTQSSRLRDALWLALVIGLGLLAGHAQTSLYGLFLLVVYLAFRSAVVFHHQESMRPSSESLRGGAAAEAIPGPETATPPSAARGDGLQTLTKARSIFGVDRLLRGMMPWWLRIISLSAVSLLLGIGLAAIQLLPAAELARESQRAGGLDYTLAMTHSYWPWRLLTLLMPDLFGNPAYGNFWGYDNYWENAAYIGLMPLALAGAATTEWWRIRRMKDEGGRIKDEGGSSDAIPSSLQPPISNLHRLTPFFLLTAIASLVLAFGWFTPIYPFLFRTVPGFSLFQGPARWLSVFTIALCALAGIGAESLLRSPGDWRRSLKWIVVGLALAGAGLVSRSFLVGRTSTFPDATLRLGVLVALGSVLWGLRPPRDDRRFGVWSIAFAGLIALDLLTAHAALNPSIDPMLYRAPNAVADDVRAADAGRVFMFDADDDAVRKRYGISLPFADFGPSDVRSWLDFRATLIANTSMIDAIPSAANFDSLLVGDYLRLRDAVNDQPFDAAMRLLRLMHVAYVASPRELPLPVASRTTVATLYRVEDSLPRVWFVSDARYESDALAAVLDPAFDPRNLVILSGAPAGESNSSDTTTRLPSFSLISLHDTPNTVRIRAASDGDGYLILADSWYPGWRATLDGQPAPILRANVAFRAVRFPAGGHDIEFVYQPDSFRVGGWATVVCAGLVFLGLIVLARRR